MRESVHFLRPVRKADNLPPSRAVVTKSGNPNFLEPSGPLRACNETYLPFFTVYTYNFNMKFLNSAHTVHLYILRLTQNKTAIICYTTLTDWLQAFITEYTTLSDLSRPSAPMTPPSPSPSVSGPSWIENFIRIREEPVSIPA